jgi:hypothetical protein
VWLSGNAARARRGEIETAKPPGLNRDGFAFVPARRRVCSHGIGWLSKTAMKRLTSLSHPVPWCAGGGVPVPTDKV